MLITEILTKETINLNVQASTKEEAMEQLVALMHAQGSVADAGQFLTDVRKREESSSTGIGFGVAIPHGKSAGVSRPALAFAKFVEPVEWNSIDEKPVVMAFLIGVPLEQAGQEHLKILTTLARKLVHESFRDQLMQAQSADDILQALSF